MLSWLSSSYLPSQRATAGKQLLIHMLMASVLTTHKGYITMQTFDLSSVRNVQILNSVAAWVSEIRIIRKTENECISPETY